MPVPHAPPSALGQALDAVDVHTASQAALAAALARGFFALTSEHASGAAATTRLSVGLYDARPSVRASYVVERAGGRLRLVDTLREEEEEEEEELGGEGLRQRRGKKEAKARKAVAPKPIRHSLHALPSARLREAAEAFESALVAAVEVANAERVAREKLERFTGEGVQTDV